MIIASEHICQLLRKVFWNFQHGIIAIVGQSIFGILFRHKLPPDCIIGAQTFHNIIAGIYRIALQRDPTVQIYHCNLNSIGIAIRVPTGYNIHPCIQRRQYKQSQHNQHCHRIMCHIIQITAINRKNMFYPGLFFFFSIFFHVPNPPLEVLLSILR